LPFTAFCVLRLHGLLHVVWLLVGYTFTHTVGYAHTRCGCVVGYGLFGWLRLRLVTHTLRTLRFPVVTLHAVGSHTVTLPRYTQLPTRLRSRFGCYDFLCRLPRLRFTFWVIYGYVGYRTLRLRYAFTAHTRLRLRFVVYTLRCLRLRLVGSLVVVTFVCTVYLHTVHRTVVTVRFTRFCFTRLLPLRCHYAHCGWLLLRARFTRLRLRGWILPHVYVHTRVGYGCSTFCTHTVTFTRFTFVYTVTRTFTPVGRYCLRLRFTGCYRLRLVTLLPRYTHAVYVHRLVTRTVVAVYHGYLRSHGLHHRTFAVWLYGLHVYTWFITRYVYGAVGSFFGWLIYTHVGSHRTFYGSVRIWFAHTFTLPFRLVTYGCYRSLPFALVTVTRLRLRTHTRIYGCYAHGYTPGFYTRLYGLHYGYVVPFTLPVTLRWLRFTRLHVCVYGYRLVYALHLVTLVTHVTGCSLPRLFTLLVAVVTLRALRVGFTVTRVYVVYVVGYVYARLHVVTVCYYRCPPPHRFPLRLRLHGSHLRLHGYTRLLRLVHTVWFTVPRSHPRLRLRFTHVVTFTTFPVTHVLHVPVRCCFYATRLRSVTHALVTFTHVYHTHVCYVYVAVLPLFTVVTFCRLRLPFTHIYFTRFTTCGCLRYTFYRLRLFTFVRFTRFVTVYSFTPLIYGSGYTVYTVYICRLRLRWLRLLRTVTFCSARLRTRLLPLVAVTYTRLRYHVLRYTRLRSPLRLPAFVGLVTGSRGSGWFVTGRYAFYRTHVYHTFLHVGLLRLVTHTHVGLRTFTALDHTHGYVLHGCYAPVCGYVYLRLRLRFLPLVYGCYVSRSAFTLRFPLPPFTGWFTFTVAFAHTFCVYVCYVLPRLVVPLRVCVWLFCLVTVTVPVTVVTRLRLRLRLRYTLHTFGLRFCVTTHYGWFVLPVTVPFVYHVTRLVRSVSYLRLPRSTFTGSTHTTPLPVGYLRSPPTCTALPALRLPFATHVLPLVTVCGYVTTRYVYAFVGYGCCHTLPTAHAHVYVAPRSPRALRTFTRGYGYGLVYGYVLRLRVWIFHARFYVYTHTHGYVYVGLVDFTLRLRLPFGWLRVYSLRLHTVVCTFGYARLVTRVYGYRTFAGWFYTLHTRLVYHAPPLVAGLRLRSFPVVHTRLRLVILPPLHTGYGCVYVRLLRTRLHTVTHVDFTVVTHTVSVTLRITHYVYRYRYAFTFTTRTFGYRTRTRYHTYVFVYHTVYTVPRLRLDFTVAVTFARLRLLVTVVTVAVGHVLRTHALPFHGLPVGYRLRLPVLCVYFTVTLRCGLPRAVTFTVGYVGLVYCGCRYTVQLHTFAAFTVYVPVCVGYGCVYGYVCCTFYTFTG